MFRRMLLVVVAVLIAGPVWGDDARGNYAAKLNPTCSEVLRDYAISDLKDEGSRISYNIHFGNDIGWIAGYMTRVNFDTPGKKNYFHALIDEVAWVASWCRDNTSETLARAMEVLTNARTK